MRLCPECHQEVPDTAVICPHCDSPRLMDGMSDAEILRAHDPVKEYEARRKKEVRIFCAIGAFGLLVVGGIVALSIFVPGAGTLAELRPRTIRRMIIVTLVSVGCLIHAWWRYQEAREDYSKEP